MPNPTQHQRTRRSIAFVSEKGGTGKTTTLLNLAQSTRYMGSSCIIIDCDPQASVSLWFDLVAASKDSSMKKFEQLLPDCQPARTAEDLRDIHNSLDELERNNDGYDWVFYDLAGYFGDNIEYGAQAEMLREVLKHVDCLITPIVPDAFTVITAVKATPKINNLIEFLGRKDEIKCFTLLNRIRSNESISIHTKESVEQYVAEGVLWPLLDNFIEHMASIPLHLSKGRNSFIPHMHHKTAQAYEQVLKEVMDIIAPEKVRSSTSLSHRNSKMKRILIQRAKEDEQLETQE